MAFTATIRHSENIALIDLTGSLTAFEMGGLRESISRLLKQGYKKFVLNLGDLKYLDSSGVGELVRNYMSVIKTGGEMRVVGLTARVEEIMKVTQLHQVFEDFQDENTALQSFAGESRSTAGE